MTENKTRVWAKTGKGADVRAEAEKEATGIVKAKARLEIGTVEVKAGSKGKIAAKMEERSVDKGLTNTMPTTSWAVSGGENDTDFVPKAGGEATKLPGISCVSEATAASGATHKDGTGIDAWFWVGEEAGIGPWFWNGEKAGHQFSAKNVDETDTGLSINVEELGIESVTGASCKPRPELEKLVEEELKGQKEQKEEKEKDKKKKKKKKKKTEVFIGNWFWDGDDTSFDPNPKPVYRIIKPQVVCEADEKNKLKEWCEGTAWHNTSAEISAFLAFASQVLQRMRHVSYNSPSSSKKNTGSLSLDDSSLSEGTSICLESIDAYPLESETCTQTIEKIREQIRIRELNGIKRFDCPCKMECCLGSEGFEKLVSLLKSNTDPLIHKIAQIAMGIINVHPLAPQCINEMGVLNVIESLLDFQFPNVTRKSEITLNPISAEEKQRMIQLHVLHSCKDTVTFPLNSPGQRSGLKELGQLTTNFDYHYIISTYFAELCQVLCLGNSKTRNLVLKIILNMSENPMTARDMIDFDYLSVLKLIFSQTEAKANLVTAVAILLNIKEHIRKGSIIVVNPQCYDELKAMFREVKTIIERL